MWSDRHSIRNDDSINRTGKKIEHEKEAHEAKQPAKVNIKTTELYFQKYRFKVKVKQEKTN